jgi:sec-independent protein translocase protein TatB
MLFDIGATELLAIVIIAIVVIGPKELPMAMRTIGRWVSQARQLVGQFRTSLDSIAHDAEMEALEKKWAEQNARIMKEHGDGKPMLPMDEMASYGAPIDADNIENNGESAEKKGKSDTPISPDKAADAAVKGDGEKL